ncbi:MAG: hypothetical protein A2887_03630 [Alphaproteobacteria bacterium RIFCSPLOWO2_01_FULL_40_26]|nr:MAG: hypothetical protein A3D15_04785 [Alphaproteobacteria bacterium RIFCSPHIGHO2_02_FULL_40_34]OFW95289.1 MAG: hypothetical protein A2887_03630 [Alphaproteobacteria bacterium RIFCSPLOWO2_01_FULL_40_26]OFX09192.1 MAG: hypothetical protein A3H30_06335 [Alphaproteobacteria bacterium RIFCSPLOWO2_02_FULL_40_19]OFX11548.1 MAG: hypothetical protein A3G22_04940 [Alphaproteobacteria bacterium RIFCSPLOWO2_12_FULL_40_11]
MFAIRFGLGAIKAVGFSMMENAVKERKANGKFSDLYDFVTRLDPKSINKKSIEALAKAGAFDSLLKNRRQVAESFNILSAYANEKNEERSSNQMSLFSALPEVNLAPDLKKISDWNKTERLQKEFEAFGFFLNEHPIDDFLPDLRKRGIIFSDKLERDELVDGNLVKMAGVVSSSKHRSGSRGRFAYLTMSDPFGIFEAMIFDEALITSARDVIVDSSMVVLECLIRKDDGGIRILVREIKRLDEFIKNTKAAEKDFEDIKRQISRNRGNNQNYGHVANQLSEKSEPLIYKGSSSLKMVRNGDLRQSHYEIAIEAKKEKRIFNEIAISLMSHEPLPVLKSILTNPGTTKIFLKVGENKIELPQKCLLEETDILRIKNVSGILKLEIIS